MTTETKLAPAKPASKKAEVKPPLGLPPRQLHECSRIDEIYAAIGRYIDASKQIPKEWTVELLELAKSNFSK